VGKVTEQVLNKAGISTIGDLQGHHGDLRALVGSFGPTLKQFAFGEDDRPLDLGDEIKSISGEETFLQDTDNRKILRACLQKTQAPHMHILSPQVQFPNSPAGLNCPNIFNAE
jgi:nucleotidyltransferase/DNA polymerase involved in DNA repair